MSFYCSESDAIDDIKQVCIDRGENPRIFVAKHSVPDDNPAVRIATIAVVTRVDNFDLITALSKLYFSGHGDIRFSGSDTDVQDSDTILSYLYFEATIKPIFQ